MASYGYALLFESPNSFADGKVTNFSYFPIDNACELIENNKRLFKALCPRDVDPHFFALTEAIMAF